MNLKMELQLSFFLLVLLHPSVISLSHSVSTCNCTDGVTLMTKDDIEEHLSTNLVKSLSASIVEKISDELENTVSEKLSRLIQPVLTRINALHQPGKSPSHPAASCKEIYKYDPTIPSGHYWIELSNGTAVSKFCDMTRTCGGVTGGWMQVTKLDMRNSGSRCPSGLRERVHTTKRLCGVVRESRDNCYNGVGIFYSTNGIEYNNVCGKIIAYQYGHPDAFRRQSSIDRYYVDGVSLTHGRNPRKHIWTFAAALDEVGSHPVNNCPCTNVLLASDVVHPPSFVGNDYFCDTGSTHRFRSNHLYDEDPLWDGAGCGPADTCCSLNNPPWFFKQLPSATRDDIEMRVCVDEGGENEDVRIEQIEIYVR